MLRVLGERCQKSYQRDQAKVPAGSAILLVTSPKERVDAQHWASLGNREPARGSLSLLTGERFICLTLATHLVAGKP